MTMLMSALLWSRDLIILTMSLTGKLIEVNVASVSEISELGKDLLFLRGVHLEAKNLFKRFTFSKLFSSKLFSKSIGSIKSTF